MTENTADPTTGLTPLQMKAIRDTWQPVRADLKKIGVLFFMELFRVHPEYQSKFRSFAKVPRDQLQDNKRLAAHASNVMASLTNLVDNIDDVECLHELLIKLGENHGRRKLQSEDFQNVCKVLINFLESTLGDKFTAEAEEAWKQALKVMVSIISKGLQGNPDE